MPTTKGNTYVKSLCKDGQGSGSRVVTACEPRPLSSPWQFVMAVAALLDFGSTLINRRFLFSHDAYYDHDHDHHPLLSSVPYRPSSSSSQSSANVVVVSFFVWLDAHSVQFGFLFSMLWFFEAFKDADRRARRALREVDRRKIMSSLATVLRRRKSLISPFKMSNNNNNSNDDNSSMALEQYKVFFFYWASLIVQLLILPIGKCLSRRDPSI
jgi:hypothetical protein